MKIHFIQHVSHENPGSIVSWIEKNNLKCSVTRTFNNDPFPELSDFDWLIILGGPMSTSDESLFPWLKEEKKIIGKAIKNKKRIMGICLGAQLIAEVLGARVYRNNVLEIGWHPIFLTDKGKKSVFFDNFSDNELVFQWHGDTFELPKNAKLLAKSEACERQAFIYNNHILGLQFHLEFTPEIVEQLIHQSADDLTKGDYVQNAHEMLMPADNFSKNNKLMSHLLDVFSQI